MSMSMINLKELPTKPGIYRIVNIHNGKCYVGSSTNIHRRIIEHISRLKCRENGRILQSAWNKYGEDGFRVEVLELCSIHELIELEQKFIDTLCPEYNISPLANGYYPSDDVKKKISQGLKKRFTPEEMKAKMNWMSGLRKPNFWKTSEYRNKMSGIIKKLWENPETRNKILSSPTRGNYKLNESDVMDIRRLHTIEKMSNKKISEIYKVSEGAIQHITSYLSWRDVE